MSDDLDIMSELIEESREHLDNIEPAFLEMEALEADTPPEQINSIFRAMHSIKGGFGFVAKERIVELAHIMENVLMRVRDGEETICKDMVGALISGTDTLRVMVEDVEQSDVIDIQNHLDELRPFTGVAAVTSAPQQESEAAKAPTKKGYDLDDLPSACTEQILQALDTGMLIFTVIASSPEELPTLAGEMEGAGDVIFLGDHEGVPIIVYSTVLEKDMVSISLDGSEYQGVYQYGEELLPFSKSPSSNSESSTTTEAQAETKELEEQSSVESQAEAATPPAPSPQAEKPSAAAKPSSPKATTPPKASPKASPAKSNDSIRVRTDVLSKLVDTAGELILGRNRVMDVVGQKLSDLPGLNERMMQIFDRFNESQQLIKEEAEMGDLGSVLHFMEKEQLEIQQMIKDTFEMRLQDSPNINSIFQNFSQVSSEIQNGIMGTRLQPVGSVFSKFPRVIRDMNKKLGKEIELLIEGEDVELDKSVIEGLGDPLTHLVRNSADHGIESPDDREAAGKPRKGTVKLIARHEGGQVHVIIEDDGGGINTDRVREKAVENGLMSQEEADALPEKEAFTLIFAAGFSTAAVVSDVSGRGVGMDVVRTNIEKLGGRIDVDSKRGQGTVLTLVLPLTLAIIPSLGVEAAGSRYAIPQVAIEELVRVAPHEAADRIATVGGRPVLKLRDQLLPIVRLSDVLGITRYVHLESGETIEDRRQEIADRRSEELTSSQNPKELEEVSALRQHDRRSQRGRSYIVVLKSVGLRYGLVVDKLHSPQEVVVKPLSQRLKNIGVYAGATIRSDGNVTMILDADGIAKDANIRIDSRAEKKEEVTHANIREAQTMLEFQVGGEEHFAVNLSMVARVEEVDASRLQSSGDKEFLKYEDSSLRVIRLHHFLNINPPQEEPKSWFVLVPRLVPHPIGILIEKPVGIFETDSEMNTEQVVENGIHGSLVIDSRMIVFLDLYSLFEKASPELYHKSSSERHSTFKDKKILLAEDTALFRTVMKDFLTSLDFHTVDVAENGAIAFDMLKNGDYDILITDIIMPEMDGMELSRAIRADANLCELPIVAVTSLMNDSDKKRIMDSGVNSYQQKLDKETLASALSNVLQQEVHS